MVEGHPALPWPLEVARFGAGFWALSLLPVLLVWFFNERFHRWWVRCFWRGHTVVSGHCDRTLSLIQDLRRVGEKIVFIGQCPGADAELPHGILYLPNGNRRAAGWLPSTALHRSTNLIALNEEDAANLELLFTAETICDRRRRRPPPLQCQAHLSDIHLYRGLNLTIGQNLLSSDSIRHELFNYYQLVARHLACRHPLPETLLERADDDAMPPPEHYVIVGFGAFGQNVALELVKKGQQLVRRLDRAGEPDEWKVVKPKVTIIDIAGETAVSPFRSAHPAFFDQCDCQVLSLSCEDPDFLGVTFLSKEDAPSRTSIIFCLEREALCLRTALLIRNRCQEPDKDVEAIYLRLARPERMGRLPTELSGRALKPELHFFAPDRDIFTGDVILHQSHDILAKKIHEAWLEVAEADARANNQPTAYGKSWNQLSDEDRDSNREAADHLWAKLRTLGYRLEPIPSETWRSRLNFLRVWEWKTRKEEERRSMELETEERRKLAKELKEREEELARVEHYRWMTWRLLNGWRWGETRDNEKRLHPDIIPYEDLGSSTQEKDKTNVRVIPKLLDAGRLRAVKG